MDTKIEEIWKDVVGYEGFYKISNFGRVNSLARNKLMSPGIDDKGYLRVCLTKLGIRKTLRMHRMIMLSFVPNPLKRTDINHKNGVKSDCRLCNLEWCTRSENVLHAVRTGLKSRPKGVLNNKAVLNERDVLEIRASRKDRNRHTIRLLSNKFGITYHHVRSVMYYKSWKHVV